MSYIMCYGRANPAPDRLIESSLRANRMKILKYFVGSLIISFAILLLVAMVMISIQVPLPEAVSRYLLLIWLVLAVVLFPLAKRIVRA